MRRIFLNPEQFSDDLVRVTGADLHHLSSVLRLRVGEELILLDNRGGAFRSVVTAVAKREMLAQITGPAEAAGEPGIHITVAQSLGKGDKFEQVIQHGTEIGASSFIPMVTEHVLERAAGKNRQARWELVAKGAAEQCGRSRIPVVEPVTSFTELVARFGEYRVVLMLDSEGEALPALTGQTVLILVGPEGGFSPRELQQGKDAGARVVSLGSFTLRTETAALVAVSRIL